MNNKRRYRDVVLAGLLLLLPAMILRSSLKEPENIGTLDQVVLRISSPLQAAANWVVGGIGGLWNGYFWLVDVEDENQQLRAANLRLREEVGQARNTIAHVKSLEDLVGLQRATHAQTAAAHVISSSINSQFRVHRIELNQGGDGIAVGMPVMSAQGLVGRILHSYGDYSDVLLVSDPQSSIDVMVPARGGRGLLKGLASDDAYLCEIEYLEQGKKVAVGDRVVTSGLGTHFPEGLLVGVISEIDSSQHGLYQKVKVKPAVDFSAVDSVLVLMAPPPPADPGRNEIRVSDTAHGLEPF